VGKSLNLLMLLQELVLGERKNCLLLQDQVLGDNGDRLILYDSVAGDRGDQAVLYNLVLGEKVGLLRMQDCVDGKRLHLLWEAEPVSICLSCCRRSMQWLSVFCRQGRRMLFITVLVCTELNPSGRNVTAATQEQSGF